MYPALSLFIDGAFLPAAGRTTEPVLDPISRLSWSPRLESPAQQARRQPPGLSGKIRFSRR